MATDLGSVAEKSVIKITMTFTDDDDAAVTPASVKWSLTDPDGTVINARDQVVISGMAASLSVGLSGSDLALTAGASKIRYFVVEATYDSTDLGNGVVLKGEARFTITDLRKIT